MLFKPAGVKVNRTLSRIMFASRSSRAKSRRTRRTRLGASLRCVSHGAIMRSSSLLILILSIAIIILSSIRPRLTAGINSAISNAQEQSSEKSPTNYAPSMGCPSSKILSRAAAVTAHGSAANRRLIKVNCVRLLTLFCLTARLLSSFWRR